MSEVDLLCALAAWHEDTFQAAGELGVVIEFERTQDDRPKPSAWVVLEGRWRLGELIVWSTGEAEYMTGDESGPDVSEHHELGNVCELHELLGRLLNSVSESGVI